MENKKRKQASLLYFVKKKQTDASSYDVNLGIAKCNKPERKQNIHIATMPRNC